MMTLANYGIGSAKHKDPNSAKALSKSLQIRNRAEITLKQCLKSHHRIPDDKRNEIIESIKEYYSRVPFNMLIWNKYQTKQSIIDSVLLLDTKFDPYKSMEAFRTIEKMLINLVYLPWHKEFRRIYTYSGYFKLIVSDPLIGIEEVLRAAGFKYEPNDSMHLVLPDHLMPQLDDGESVTSVIFDCLIAQVVLANMIEVFENCCRASKQPIIEHLRGEINCYSWIQAYFRERSNQTTEAACFNIQELLNNITNHLSKCEISAIKSSGSRIDDDHLNPANSQSSDKDLLNLHSTSSNVRDYPTSSAQERTRKFLAQQQLQREEANLLKLSDELLRLPSDSDKRLPHANAAKKYSNQEIVATKYINYLPSETSSKNKMSIHDNGYIPANHININPTIATGRFGSSKLIESYDTTDNKTTLGHQRVLASEPMSHHIGVDPPHNDRELLIPKQDRRYMPQTQTSTASQVKLDFLHESDFSSSYQLARQYNSHLSGMNSASQNQNRHQYNNSYFDGLPSQNQTSSLSNQHNRGLSSKYTNMSNRKYESRDPEKPSNRTHWSCNSCTYNNLISSEICEMCRTRRIFR